MRLIAVLLCCFVSVACSKDEPAAATRGARGAAHEPRMPAYFEHQAERSRTVEPSAAAEGAAEGEPAAAASAPASSPASAKAAPDADVFESASVGLRLRKPAGWRRESAAEIAAAREALRAQQPVLGMSLSLLPRPLASFTRDPAGHAGFSPSILVAVRPAGDEAGALEALRAALPALTLGLGASGGAAPVVLATKVGGRDAAEARLRHTARAGATPVESRIFLVPRGASQLVLVLTGAQKGADRAEAELGATLRSVELR